MKNIINDKIVVEILDYVADNVLKWNFEIKKMKIKGERNLDKKLDKLLLEKTEKKIKLYNKETNDIIIEIIFELKK